LPSSSPTTSLRRPYGGIPSEDRDLALLLHRGALGSIAKEGGEEKGRGLWEKKQHLFLSRDGEGNL